jgi:hypothetical protein
MVGNFARTVRTDLDESIDYPEERYKDKNECN